MPQLWIVTRIITVVLALNVASAALAQDVPVLHPEHRGGCDLSEENYARYAVFDSLLMMDPAMLDSAGTARLDVLMFDIGEAGPETPCQIFGPGCSWYCGGGPEEVTASSVSADADSLFAPWHAHDLDYCTAWCEGVKGNGVGERLIYLEVNFCGRRLFPYLHIDDLGVHAFITQHYGDKEVIVFPPDQEQYLYRSGKERFSLIQDVDNPDLVRFPLFAKAEAIRFTLHAGESVFMPCGWWHTTKVHGTSLSTVISVSNSSNWSELIAFLKENSNHTAVAGAYTAYLRGYGFLRSLVG